MKRRKTSEVQIGKIKIGGSHPIVIQSMTNTDTSDVQATVAQILELALAGAEIVRITVNDEAAASAVPEIITQVRKKSPVPIVGDFHFNGNKLLKKYPECAQALDKYRINPGNAHDQNFREMVEIAIANQKPVRIGVNAGSIDAKIMQELMDKLKGQSSQEILEQAVIASALKSAQFAESLGLAKEKIVLSAKMSDVTSVIRVYEELAKKCDYALHLGLTEAGSGDQGIIKTSIALGTLLSQGIGDTIRVSLTPVQGVPRSQEVTVCQEILQALDLRRYSPRIISCPGCGRTSNEKFLPLVESLNKKCVQLKETHPHIKDTSIAIMGCVVNGPGESRHADIGISLPGKSEKPFAQVYLRGEHFCDLKGENIDDQFIDILEKYLQQK